MKKSKLNKIMKSYYMEEINCIHYKSPDILPGNAIGAKRTGFKSVLSNLAFSLSIFIISSAILIAANKSGYKINYAKDMDVKIKILKSVITTDWENSINHLQQKNKSIDFYNYNTLNKECIT